MEVDAYNLCCEFPLVQKLNYVSQACHNKAEISILYNIMSKLMDVYDAAINLSH